MDGGLFSRSVHTDKPNCRVINPSTASPNPVPVCSMWQGRRSHWRLSGIGLGEARAILCPRLNSGLGNALNGTGLGWAG